MRCDEWEMFRGTVTDEMVPPPCGTVGIEPRSAEATPQTLINVKIIALDPFQGAQGPRLQES
jgi:hypothetical protein